MFEVASMLAGDVCPWQNMLTDWVQRNYLGLCDDNLHFLPIAAAPFKKVAP